MSVIAKNLRWIRKKQNISQTEFANVFGITRASVGAYEEGRAEPKLELLMKITKHYQLDLSSFIEQELNIVSVESVINKVKMRPSNTIAEDNYIEEFLDVKSSVKSVPRSLAQVSNSKKKIITKDRTIPFYKSAKNQTQISVSTWPFFEGCDAVFECNPHLERENLTYKDGFIFITSRIEQEGIYKGSFIQKDGNRLILNEEELVWDKSALETWKIIYIIESISNFKL